jgi:hypothetical protein
MLANRWCLLGERHWTLSMALSRGSVAVRIPGATDFARRHGRCRTAEPHWRRIHRWFVDWRGVRKTGFAGLVDGCVGTKFGDGEVVVVYVFFLVQVGGREELEQCLLGPIMYGDARHRTGLGHPGQLGETARGTQKNLGVASRQSLSLRPFVHYVGHVRRQAHLRFGCSLVVVVVVSGIRDKVLASDAAGKFAPQRDPGRGHAIGHFHNPRQYLGGIVHYKKTQWTLVWPEWRVHESHGATDHGCRFIHDGQIGNDKKDGRPEKGVTKIANSVDIVRPIFVLVELVCNLQLYLGIVHAECESRLGRKDKVRLGRFGENANLLTMVSQLHLQFYIAMTPSS